MQISAECLKFFAQAIESETGIVYSEVNFYQLEGRLNDLAKKLQFDDVASLWKQVKSQGMNSTMQATLIDLATNNETSFFRDANVFKAIFKIILQHRDSAPGPHTYRIWSAACSNGQEIYSLAMMLAELTQNPHFNYELLATDIADRALKRATQGTYSQLEVQRGLSAEQLKQFFTEDKNTTDPMAAWSVKSELKQRLKFKKLNLLEPWGNLGVFDLILCRNVLIYQTIENKKKVVAKLYEHLAPGGYLILGGAESLIGIFEALEYTSMDNLVVYRRPLM